MHDLDVKYQQTIHEYDLVVKDEEARRLKLRSMILRDEASMLRDRLAQQDARIKDLVEQVDDSRRQLDASREKSRRQDKVVQSQAREINNLKEELSAFNEVSQNSSKILSEKLALSREIAVLKPELEHLRSQLAHQKDVLAEKVALERQLNTLEVELANEKQAAQKAAQKRNEDSQAEQDLRKRVQELEKELANEKQASEANMRNHESEKSETERELKSLREQLAGVDAKLAAERRKVEQLTKSQADSASGVQEELERLRASLEEAQKALAAEKRAAQRHVKRETSPTGEDATRLREELEQARKELAEQRKAQDRLQKEFEQAQADAEERQQAAFDKIDRLRNKLRDAREELKKCQAELEKAQERAAKHSNVTMAAMTVSLKGAGVKANAKKKRSADEMSVDDKVLLTPSNLDNRPKRPLKKRGFDVSKVGDKSEFSITPFLNKTANVEGSPKLGGDDASPTPPVQFRGAEQPTASEATEAAPEETATEKPTAPEPASTKPAEKRPRGRPRTKPLGDSSPSKRNLTAPTRKAPRAESNLEKVAEEPDEADGSTKQDQENRSSGGADSEPTSKIAVSGAVSGAVNGSATSRAPEKAEPKKKKRKLLGANTSTLFDGGEDEGERVQSLAAHTLPRATPGPPGRLARSQPPPTPAPAPALALALALALPTQARLGSSSASSRWKQRQGADPFTRAARVKGLKSRAAFKLLELDEKYRLFRRGRGQVVVDLGYAPGSWSQVAVDRTAPDGTVVGIDIIPAQPPRGVSTIQGNFLSPGVRDMVKQFLLDTERKRRAERAAARKARRARAEREEEVVGVGVGGEDGGEDGPAKVVADRPSYIDLERMAASQREAESGDDGAAPLSSSSAAEGSTEPAEEEDDEKPNLRLVDVVLSDMSEPWPQTHGFSVNSLSNPYLRMMNTSGIVFKDHAGSMDLCHAALSFASETLKPGGHFVCKFYQGAEDKAFEMLLKAMFDKVHREKPESSRSESREAFFVALRRKGDVTLEDIEPR
ncbi:hypothetical protein VTH06DRAFT_7356 [Thermothelomyces fergusii]